MPPDRQPRPQLGEQLGQHRPGVVVEGEGDVLPRHPEVVVGVEVVGRAEQGDDPGEALLPDPDDLLLAADGTVGPGVAAGALADRQLVLDDPGEVPGGDPGGPLALHDDRHGQQAQGLHGGARRRGPAPSPPPGRRPTPPPPATPPAGRRPPPATPPSAVTRPRNVLRLAPTSTGQPVAASDRVARSRARLWAAGLAEPDPGVDPDLLHARVPGRRGPLHQERPHLGHHVVVGGSLLHRPGLAPHVHGHPAHARPGRGRHRPQRRRHVVDQGRPRRHRLLGHRRPPGVDRDPHVGGQGLDHGQHPPQLLVLRHRLGPGPGALPAHVDHVGALGDHGQAVGDGCVGIEPASAVGERVGSHVEDSHHQGTGHDGERTGADSA